MVLLRYEKTRSNLKSNRPSGAVYLCRKGTKMKIKEEFASVTTLEELKAVYKRLAMKHHPDRGGDVETMKEINATYDELFAKFSHIHKNYKTGEYYEKKTAETPEEFKDIVDKLMKMQGIIIEIIGSFIWVSGDDKPHKEELKAMGFRWHKKKKVWVKPPAGYRKRSRRNYSMDEIRGMYGTTGQFTGQDKNEIVA